MPFFLEGEQGVVCFRDVRKFCEKNKTTRGKKNLKKILEKNSKNFKFSSLSEREARERGQKGGGVLTLANVLDVRSAPREQGSEFGLVAQKALSVALRCFFVSLSCRENT
jgi:hypothetical protein